MEGKTFVFNMIRLEDSLSIKHNKEKQHFMTKELSNTIKNLVFFDLKHG